MEGNQSPQPGSTLGVQGSRNAGPESRQSSEGSSNNQNGRPERRRKRPVRYAQSPEVSKQTPKKHSRERRSADGPYDTGSRERRVRKQKRKNALEPPRKGKRGSSSQVSRGKYRSSGSSKMFPPELVHATLKSVEITCPMPTDSNITRVDIQMHKLVPTKHSNSRTNWESVAELDVNEAQRVSVTGLRANTTYFFRCRGRTEDGKWSPFSQKSKAMLTPAPQQNRRKRTGDHDDFQPPKKTRVGCAKPGQPRPPICVRRTPTTITIAWSAPKDTGRLAIDSFQVQKKLFAEDDTRRESTKNWEDVFSRQGFDGKMYEVTGLKPNTVLQFRVKAKNALGWSKFSRNSDPFTTTKAQPEFKVPAAPDDKYSIVLNVDDIRYDEQKVRLGRGSFGVVYRSAVGGYRGTTVAVKVETQVYDDSDTDADDQLKDWLREVKILACLRHPNLVLYMGACRAHGRRYIVTEYMGGGSLSCALHTSAVPLTEKWRITSILLQVASAMAYLHSNQPEITHRDLKPANVLLDKTWTHAKVCDFGLARMHRQEIMSTLTKFAGTAPYMPPEALDEIDVTGKVDVYSFGVMVAETLLRTPPWKGMGSSAIVKAVCLQDKRPFDLDKFEKPVGALIERCWHKKPLNRPSFNDILEELGKLGWTS
uniref:Uncharacterized protein n=1 Tax=Lotharella globosa TaxID=91324 RepID=A0A6U3CE89_9EUKA|mmetsp:Transcript_12734/g.25991  ORF Transcript_12734/g.25991 Transcript_12734/m.25991 type:complete len:650 (-) Transcript_12734:636-2585(-)|eukprot:CAMPEP_0167787254 /NCGR_PEP_ID=MMETSP0111_2-20121227/9300_1 /TAXON_ID=91324 /ORGANISM="Lotharella globosa, Strain CCCM811" /LENGTH=649 /DNA_ID=CAMNT_0007678835 /DNA_START=244 /DNA_END=2193 /DNA_ORIENTATION=+